MGEEEVNKIRKLFECLLRIYGPQNWWPCEGEKYGNDEIAIGAILTQNTSWKNVEKALENLRNENLISLKKISKLDVKKLSELIKPAGFYNQKAERLKLFSQYIVERYGDLKKFFECGKVEKLREELLAIKGIGRETADSILLYAGFKNIFVVDKYTYRIFKYHGIIEDEKFDYEKIRDMVEKEIKTVEEKQEFHALLVAYGKEFRMEERRKEVEKCLKDL